jgi:hypothetical protein
VLDRADAIERQIYGVPACGRIGPAIKGYFVARMARVDDLDADDACASLGTINPVTT